MAQLSEGIPLAEICRGEGMPNAETVRNWQKADSAFSLAIAGAREDGFDRIAADTMRIADTPLEGERELVKADGKIEITREDMLGHRRLQIETRLKLLAKWDPKRYGDATTLRGDPGAPLSPGVILAPPLDPPPE